MKLTTIILSILLALSSVESFSRHSENVSEARRKLFGRPGKPDEPDGDERDLRGFRGLKKKSPKGKDKSEKSPKGKGKGRSDSDDKKKSEKSPKGKGKGESKSPKGKGKGDRSPKGKGKGDRSPKGGKGKGKGGDYADCKIIPIFQFVAELSAGFQENAVGGGFDNVPFYSQETGQQLGFYTDSAADLDSEDCAGTGSFSFDFQEPYENQIAFQFTCFGQFNSITGGNGAFGCASGFEEFVFEDDEVIASQLYVCGSLCPFVMKLK